MENKGLEFLRRKNLFGIFVLATAVLIASMGTSIVTVALPALARDFVQPVTSVQLVILAYLLSVTVTIVIAGRLGDLKGRRFILLIGLLLFALSSVGCSMAPDLTSLIFARILQGVGGAILMALPVAIIRDIVVDEKTGFAMGLVGSMSAIGTALGPSLGGLMVSWAGWRSMFVVLACGALIVYMIVFALLPKDRKLDRAGKTQIDFLGMAVLSIVLLSYALLMSNGLGSDAGLRFGLVCFIVLGLVVFVRIERNKAFALIDLQAFKNQTITRSLTGSLLVSNIMMATLVIGPFYLTFALGLSEVLTGMVMAVGPLVAALSGVPAGKVVDRIGGRIALAWGLGQMMIGLLCLSVLPEMFGVIGYVLSLLILTPGFQLFMASNNAMVMLAAKETQRGMISGLLGLSRNLGFMTGASLMGSLFAWTVGSGDIIDASMDAIGGGFSVTFQVAAGLIVVTLALLFLGRHEAK